MTSNVFAPATATRRILRTLGGALALTVALLCSLDTARAHDAYCPLGTPAQHPSGVRVYKIRPGINFWAHNNDECRIGKSRLVMQNDGNLVLYDESNRPRFASNTQFRGTDMRFQTDGNLVVYGNGTALWASDTYSPNIGHAYFLAVQEDGNLVIYNNYFRPWQVVWATNTAH